MATREAACACGALKVTCQGEPVRMSMCHCLDCQRRTGSVFGTQARFHKAQVRIEGEAKKFVRTADSGNEVVFRFCPKCGSTVFWDNEAFPGVILVAMGAFADPNFPPPSIAVYESQAHEWAKAPGLTIERRNEG